MPQVTVYMKNKTVEMVNSFVQISSCFILA